jgi:hypothetical protein
MFIWSMHKSAPFKLHHFQMFVFHLFPSLYLLRSPPLRYLLSSALDAPSILSAISSHRRSPILSPRMQYLYHILFVAAHATSIAFIAFPRVLPLPALAKPITRSSSSQTVTVHHVSRRSVRAPKSKDSKITVAASDSFIDSSSNTSLHPRSRSAHADPGVYAGVQSRSGDVNVNTVLDQISILSSWDSKARTNAQNLSALSYLFLAGENAKNISSETYSQASKSRQNGASEFQRKCASELTAFNTNSRGFQTSLNQLSADKGRASHDNKDSIERLVKDIINLHKDVLRCFTELVYGIPELGPILGPSMSFSSYKTLPPLFIEPCPVVYELKCTLDALLDLTEKLIIDSGALRGLISDYSEAVCKPGVDVLGICL